MSYDRNTARALSTAAEYRLFAASMGHALAKHTPEQLKGKIDRARSLRDKYRDLHKRQRLAARRQTGAKEGARLESNARTRQKSELFAEVLDRFVKRAGGLAAERRKKARGAAAGKAAVKTARTGRKTAGKSVRGQTVAKKKMDAKSAGGRGFMSASARTADRRARQSNTRGRAARGHFGAAGRRRQARRDSRR